VYAYPFSTWTRVLHFVDVRPRAGLRKELYQYRRVKPCEEKEDLISLQLAAEKAAGESVRMLNKAAKVLRIIPAVGSSSAPIVSHNYYAVLFRL
jgi:hypothetical protein